MAEVPKTKKKGRLLKLAFGAVVLVAAGAGAAVGAVHYGYVGQPAAETDDAPKLLKKGDADPYTPPSEEGAVETVDGEGGSEYQTSYFSFEEPFTSNLKNSPALVQVSLAASTRRDGRVLLWLAKHELAARSAILAELANTPEGDAYSREGKQQLQRRLTQAINDILTRTEGFGGVDDVYFRGFLVQ